MKLKTNSAANKPVNMKKNKSPKKQGKGVGIRKEKSKEVIKPTVLKKEAEKTNIENPINPQKLLQQELWNKAIENVSTMPNLSDEESSIAKLLADYKSKSSIPQKNMKFQNFLTKGFSKFKDTATEVLDGIYNKVLSEFKAIGGNVNSVKAEKKKSDPAKPKSKKEDSDDEELNFEDDDIDDKDDDDDDVDDEEDNDEDDDIEEEKPKPKAKGIKANNKNGKSEPNKGKNGSKFKGGKVQKNKKFGKKK